MTILQFDDEPDDDEDDEEVDDEELDDEDEGDEDEDEPETWQVCPASQRPLTSDVRLTSPAEVPRLAAISQLIKRAGPNSAGPRPRRLVFFP
jgi:hypothetical protein